MRLGTLDCRSRTRYVGKQQAIARGERMATRVLDRAGHATGRARGGGDPVSTGTREARTACRGPVTSLISGKRFNCRLSAGIRLLTKADASRPVWPVGPGRGVAYTGWPSRCATGCDGEITQRLAGPSSCLSVDGPARAVRGATHVDVLVEPFSDAGSIPAASTINQKAPTVPGRGLRFLKLHPGRRGVRMQRQPQPGA